LEKSIDKAIKAIDSPKKNVEAKIKEETKNDFYVNIDVG